MLGHALFRPQFLCFSSSYITAIIIYHLVLGMAYFGNILFRVDLVLETPCFWVSMFACNWIQVEWLVAHRRVVGRCFEVHSSLKGHVRMISDHLPVRNYEGGKKFDQNALLYYSMVFSQNRKIHCVYQV